MDICVTPNQTAGLKQSHVAGSCFSADGWFGIRPRVIAILVGSRVHSHQSWLGRYVFIYTNVTRCIHRKITNYIYQLTECYNSDLTVCTCALYVVRYMQTSLTLCRMGE